MDFSTVWTSVQDGLEPGMKIPNWTAANGYLGDEFAIVRVESSHVEINAPNADAKQRVARKDFEFMVDNWEKYREGQIQRQTLVKRTRVSKYTISILKYLGI